MAPHSETAGRSPLLIAAIAASATVAGSLAALLVIRSLPRRRPAATGAVRRQQEIAEAASAEEQSDAKHALQRTRSISAPGQLTGPPNGDGGGSQTSGRLSHSISDVSRADGHVTAFGEMIGAPPLPSSARIGRHSIGSGSVRAAIFAAAEEVPVDSSRSFSLPSLSAELLHAAAAPWNLFRRLSGRQASWGPVLSEVLPHGLPADTGLPDAAEKGASIPTCKQQASGKPSEEAASAAAATTAAVSSPHMRLPTVAEAFMPDGTLRPTIEPASAGSRAVAAEDEGTIGLQELQLYYREDGKPFLLGRGSFGRVYKAEFRCAPVAVKVFPCDGSVRLEERFRSEISLLRSCQHEHIVGFKAACLDSPGHLLLVMELMEGGDLRSALNADADGDFCWNKRQRGPNGELVSGKGKALALDIAKGLVFLHAHHIVHLDLKSPNVLLTAAQSAKIGDVGLARFMAADYLSEQAATGTFAWTAPEVLMGRKCCNKVDVFSLGVILWELITGEAPSRGRMRALRVPEDCSAGVQNLVDACMGQTPGLRPSAAEVSELLAGDTAVLDAYSRHAPVSADEEDMTIHHDDRVQLQQAYNTCNYCIHGGPEGAAAAGYTEPPLESVVEGIRAFDGRSYSMMVDQLRDLLQSPDVEDANSKPRQRLECLIKCFLPCYTIKLKLSTRLFQELRALDMKELGKLVNSLPHTKSESTFTQTAGSSGGGSSGRTESEAPSSGSDEYAVDTSPARVEPPDDRKWRAVLAAMRLTPAQQDAYAEARQRAKRRLSELHDERNELVAELRRLSGASSLGANLDDYELAVTVSAKLRANMQAESHTLHELQVSIICDLLQPIQYARAEVAAFPAMHDPNPIGDLILDQRAQTPAPEAP